MSIEKKTELEEAKATGRPNDKNVGDSATASDSIKEKDFQKKEPGVDNSRPADKDVGDKSSEVAKTEVPQAGKEAGTVVDKEEDSTDKPVETGISPTKDEIEGKPSTDKMKTESALEEAKAKLMEKVEFKIDVSEDLGSLFESADLDQEFVDKAVTVFESAINETAKSHIESIQESALELFEAATEQHCKELDEALDKYASFAVNEWAEENKIALEAGIVVEKAKSLVSGLQSLMSEHNIAFDEESVAIHESAVEKATELEEGLEAQIDKNIELSEQLVSVQKELEVERFVAGMVDTQAEKIRGLAEELDFDSAGSFRDKLGVLKENYFPQGAGSKSSSEDMITEDAEGDVVVESEIKAPSAYPHIEAAAKMLSSFNRK